MAYVAYGNANCNSLFQKFARIHVGISALPFFQLGVNSCTVFNRGTVIPLCLNRKRSFALSENRFNCKLPKKERFSILTSRNSSNPSGSTDENSKETEKTPFGYTRKDVLLIGLGITLLGIGLKSGLEFAGVDSLQAGNVVQLVLVLGLTVGWIFTYVFRVSNKEMTYAQQLRDYESKVMEKRLESLTEAELQALLEEVEEEKRR
ncbi:uncharacterized protein LOC114177744 [Vigna unguiculata]|uniref:Uncharacterized protein n=1 Tax=Vigna unguiculata TaxID=3917 RepID=A0A4D6LAN2_VIGUN|nr:uncharacterized protein LOC114177744 [Vigna unguiculata]XP_027919050.1 uncharacterized protein LOC114177744 [Vigna unguiculata]QCD85456.1 hypothetical protein DEO72_LG2g5816 [Vigna unguiculata]